MKLKEKKDRKLDIEIISQDIDSFLEFSNKILIKKILFNFYEDDYSLMVLSFFAKQIEHLRSIRFLINSGQYSDTIIIARVMVEGLAILAWVYKNPEYAKKWRKYAVISDYKLLLKKNKEVTKEEEKNIFEALKIYGSDFHNKKLKKGNNVNKFPYVYSWLIDNQGRYISISSILRELDKHLLEIYSDLSGWVHWEIGSIGQHIQIKEDRLEIKPNITDDAALSLAAGLQSSLGVSEIINERFKLNLNDKLSNIKNKFLSDLQKLHNR